KKPLAEELLFGRLKKGGAVYVVLEDGELAFSFVEPKPPLRNGGGKGGKGGKGGSGGAGDKSGGPAGKVTELVH
ncbi:MAG: hypothetical protein VCD31_02370, partial [Alphaproteobacteria bacterium]